MDYRNLKANRHESGQSIIESAILVPFLIVLLFNAVNIGYYFTVALHLSTAPRQGAEYSIQGPVSQLQTNLPSASTVYDLVNEDITGAVAAAANPKSQVCSADVGLSNTGTSNQITDCVQYNSFSAVTPDPDPESPALVLNRVDIQYTIPPLIPGTLFNIVPSPTVHRYVQMRALM